MNHGWNESFAEKIVISRNMTKTMLHTIRWLYKVSCLRILLQFARKITLSLSWRLLAWQNKMNRVSRKNVWWNNTKHLLHTIRGGYRQFCCFVPVLFWLANSVKLAWVAQGRRIASPNTFARNQKQLERMVGQDFGVQNDLWVSWRYSLTYILGGIDSTRNCFLIFMSQQSPYMIKDHVTLRCTYGKYRTVIPTREEWDKDWPNPLRKGQICLEPIISKRLGQEFANIKTKCNGTSQWNRMQQLFQ